ncbi:MAG: response regulator transcription factor [Eubacteriales bacterium]|nr:response regulator transcription factor [Eubacteriales bacterium]
MIYILEDDDSIRKLVTYGLESQGFAAAGFGTPAAFWEALREEVPELLLLDIMLPEEDGIQVLKKLRARPDTAALPVIMLTARSAEYDRVEGLDAGADDYVTKPFGMMELLARVRALLRRSTAKGVEPPKEYRLRELLILPDRHEVFVDGQEIALTHKEYQLLLLLAENKGNVLTRELLLDRIWDLGGEPENRTLDVHIRKLRAKLGSAGSYIETVRSVGYRFRG